MKMRRDTKGECVSAIQRASPPLSVLNHQQQDAYSHRGQVEVGAVGQVDVGQVNVGHGGTSLGGTKKN